MLVFDGYDDIVRIPLERIRKVPVKPAHGSAGEDGDEGGDTFTVAPNAILSLTFRSKRYSGEHQSAVSM